MTFINRLAQQFGLALVLVLSAQAVWAEPVGKLVFAVRGVTVLHPAGGESEGSKGLELNAGDTVVTGEKGRAQLLMLDGARIALKPDSRFQIESYEPSVEQPLEGVVVASGGNDTGVLNLIKGGMRAVSGTMTKANPGGLLVKTPVATMGIRGTGWKCVLAGGDTPKLFLKVVDGQVVVKTPFGDLAVNPGEIASVVIGEAARLELEESPEFLDDDDQSDQSEEESESGDSAGDETAISGAGSDEDNSAGDDGGEGDFSGSELEEELVGEILGVFIEDDEVAELLDYFTEEELIEIIIEVISDFNVAVGGAGVRDTTDVVIVQGERNVAEFLIAEDDSLLEFIATYSEVDGQNPSADAVFSILDEQDQVTASVFNLGSDEATGFVWGRWAEGAATASPVPAEPVEEGEEPPPESDFTGEDIDLAGQQSVHWFYGPPDVGEPLADITASASYSLVGNTEPADANGNLGVLGAADLSANFTAGTVDLSLQLGINDQNWSASGAGQIQQSTHFSFAGSDLSGVITDGQANIGTVSGQFSGAFSTNIVTVEAQNVPAGAAVAYGLVGNVPAGANNAVSGVAIMGDPQVTGGGQ